MTTPQITIHDAITGEIITREMNDVEISLFEADQNKAKKDVSAKAKAEKTAADKQQTILDRLGLTTEEFQTLIG